MKTAKICCTQSKAIIELNDSVPKELENEKKLFEIIYDFANDYSKFNCKKEWMIQHVKNFNGLMMITFMDMQNR